MRNFLNQNRSSSLPLKSRQNSINFYYDFFILNGNSITSSKKLEQRENLLEIGFFFRNKLNLFFKCILLLKEKIWKSFLQRKFDRIFYIFLKWIFGFGGKNNGCPKFDKKKEFYSLFKLFALTFVMKILKKNIITQLQVFKWDSNPRFFDFPFTNYEFHFHDIKLNEISYKHPIHEDDFSPISHFSPYLNFSLFFYLKIYFDLPFRSSNKLNKNSTKQKFAQIKNELTKSS